MTTEPRYGTTINPDYGTKETLEIILANIPKQRGNIKLIAEASGVSRDTVYRYKNAHVEVAEAIKNERLSIGDDIKSRFYESCLDGDIASMIFYLKTQQGWHETNRVESVNVNIEAKAEEKQKFDEMMAEWKSEESEKRE